MLQHQARKMDNFACYVYARTSTIPKLSRFPKEIIIFHGSAVSIGYIWRDLLDPSLFWLPRRDSDLDLHTSGTFRVFSVILGISIILKSMYVGFMG